jgi:hypothetical protein
LHKNKTTSFLRATSLVAGIGPGNHVRTSHKVGKRAMEILENFVNNKDAQNPIIDLCDSRELDRQPCQRSASVLLVGKLCIMPRRLSMMVKYFTPGITHFVDSSFMISFEDA